MAVAQSTNNRRTFSGLQIGLFIAIGIFAFVTEGMVLRGYFTSGNVTQAVEDQSFVTTGLANIQREALLLYLETERSLRSPELNREAVKLRQALLANQLNLLSAQIRDASDRDGRLAQISATFREFGVMMQNRVGTTTPASAAETEEFESVLSKLESQVKSLYDDEEKSFFVALSRSLHSNQTLQIYLLALSALVLVSGGVLGVSLHRTVGALKKEMIERDRVEGHLQEANDQIVRSEKLAAIGELSGGVAHDLRNPLGAIKNAAYMLRKKMTSDGVIDTNSKYRRYLEIVDQQIARSNGIITDLMTFARVGPPTLVETHLDEVLEESLETMVKNENITLLRSVDPDLKSVMADRDQLQRVFLNLANNAQEAMPNGGQLTITAESVDSQVKILFTDTGEGISDENLSKIFDPLFTTKAKGTGLGLAVCQEIILRHGGTINARRNEDPCVGSTFEITLPAADDQPKN